MVFQATFVNDSRPTADPSGGRMVQAYQTMPENRRQFQSLRWENGLSSFMARGTALMAVDGLFQSLRWENGLSSEDGTKAGYGCEFQSLRWENGLSSKSHWCRICRWLYVSIPQVGEWSFKLTE